MKNITENLNNNTKPQRSIKIVLKLIFNFKYSEEI